MKAQDVARMLRMPKYKGKCEMVIMQTQCFTMPGLFVSTWKYKFDRRLKSSAIEN